MALASTSEIQEAFPLLYLSVKVILERLKHIG